MAAPAIKKEPLFAFSPRTAGPAGKQAVITLGAKFTLLILGGISALTLTTTLLSISQLRSSLSLGLQEMATAMGKVVGVASAYQGFFDVDTRKLNQYIDSAAGQPDVSFVALLDNQGKIVTQRGLSTLEAMALEQGNDPLPDREVYQKKQEIALDAPIGKIGTIVIGISTKRIRQEEKRIISSQVGVAVGTAVLSLVVLWIFIVSITRPLRELSRQAELIGRGDLEHPIMVKSCDEIGTLAAGIETMRGNLNDNIRRIAFIGKVSAALTAAFSLDEVVIELRRHLKEFPLWPWGEAGLALIGRGIPDHQFHYYRVFPLQAREDKKFNYFPLAHTVVGETVGKKKQLSRGGMSSASDQSDFFLSLKESGIVSDLCAPLVVKMKVLGALYVGFPDESAQRTELQEMMQTLAHELSSVIEGIYLVEDLRFNLQQLKRAHQELKGLDSLKTEFISSVSHELRTPLVSLTGYSHMMLEEKLGPITDLQREGLEVSVKSLSRLTNLIEKMLSFSSEQRAEKLEISDFSIEATLSHVLATVKAHAADKNIDIRTSVEKNLPLVRADEDKIIQVLINLIDNAVKYSPEGTRVEVKARRPFAQTPDRTGRLELLVRDHGRGMAAEQLPHIFQKFWQAPAADGERRKGLGLGLSLVKKIVELHQCVIEVESEPGKGTTFVFTLPIAPDQSVGSK
jgi:signal transduction histidine kinase/HAMP domain-containing protein